MKLSYDSILGPCSFPVLLDIPQHVHTLDFAGLLMMIKLAHGFMTDRLNSKLHFERFTVIIMNCLTATQCVLQMNQNLSTLSFPNTSLIIFIGVWPLHYVTRLVSHIYTPAFRFEWVLFAYGNNWMSFCFSNFMTTCLSIYIRFLCFDILISFTFHWLVLEVSVKTDNFFYIYTIQYYILRCGHLNKWWNSKK